MKKLLTVFFVFAMFSCIFASNVSEIDIGEQSTKQETKMQSEFNSPQPQMTFEIKSRDLLEIGNYLNVGIENEIVQNTNLEIFRSGFEDYGLTPSQITINNKSNFLTSSYKFVIRDTRNRQHQYNNNYLRC